MNEAIAARVPTVAGDTPAETFASLYERTAPKLYAYSGSSEDGLGAAADDAVGSLEDSVEILVRVLGVAIPLGLLGTGLAVAGRALRRLRREAALSG